MRTLTQALSSMVTCWLRAAIVAGLIGAGAAEAGTVEVLQPSDAFARGFDRLQLAPTARFALIIGNANYQNVQPLDNPLNDVEAVSKAASLAGFKVFKAEDVDRRGMLDAIERFLVAVTPGSEAMIYYSGHGVELDGANYLLPIDIRDLNPDQRFSLEDDAISLNSVLTHLESRQARVNIVMLDACRNNPFSSRGSKSLGDSAGLGSVEPAQGTLVLYSAATGETALDRLGPDDPDPNGLFTRNLLPLMSTPGLEIRELVQTLKAKVYSSALDAAGHTQRPSYYDGLIGQFYFLPPGMQPARESDPPPLQVVAPEGNLPDFALACSNDVEPDASIDELIISDIAGEVSNCNRAAKTFPGHSGYANLLAIAKEQNAARQAVLADEPKVSRAYLNVFPNGRYVEDVGEHLASLKPVATPTPPSVPLSSNVESLPSSSEEPVQVAVAEPQVVTPPPADLSPTELTFQIQTELARLSCGIRNADGDWGPRTTSAVKSFSKGSKMEYASNGPTAGLLDALKIAQTGICVVAQVKPQACPAGKVRAASGKCVARSPTTSRPAPAQSAPSQPKHCFLFNGETFCE